MRAAFGYSAWMHTAASGDDGAIGLEQFAGVAAALAEGFGLERVLAAEGIDPRSYRAAEPAWKARLAADGAAGGPLFRAYAEALATAEDCLARSVSPVDDDVEAWTSLLHAWSRSTDAEALLATTGLGMNDLARLRRRWACRMEADRALAVRAAKLLERGPGPLPRLDVGEPVLAPFPWSKRASEPGASKVEATPPTSSDSTEAELSIVTFAAIAAAIAETPSERPRILDRHHVDSTIYARAEAQWNARAAADPVVARDLRRLVAHHRARFAAADAEARVEVPSPKPAAAAARPSPSTPVAVPTVPDAMAAFVDVRGTKSAEVAGPSGPALPFLAEVPAAMRGFTSVSGTTDAAVGSTEPALPFDAPEPGGNWEDLARGEEGSEDPTLHAIPAAMRGFDDVRGTREASAAEPRPSLPFEVVDPSTIPTAMRHFADVHGTQDAPDAHAAGPVTPFDAGAVPALSLEHYAWLLVDLERYPERASEVVAAYGITEAQKKSAFAHWQARIAGDPRVRDVWAAFDAAKRST